MKKLHIGDKVALVANSNGLYKENAEKVERLTAVLTDMGLDVQKSKYIYAENSIFNGTGKERASELMSFFEDNSIKAVFDISGGDVANQVIGYLDFEKIKNNKKMFFGYSDLTVILNSLYSQCGLETYLYQIRNLVSDNAEKQIAEFKKTFMNDEETLLDFDYKWLKGKSMHGVVVGGNIRCFLKLSGTPYMPDFTDKILFIESLGGDVAKMATFLAQYKMLGVFDKIKGIILGTYTEMQRKEYSPSIEELVLEAVGERNIPIAKTEMIGHGTDSKCIVIGRNIKLD